jgi:hypothetical protein
MTATLQPEFTLAVSYASPDRDYVEAVVNTLKGRGVSVFYAPDEQADMIGRNLIDYLHDVYLTQARYCLVFVSKSYLSSKWTNRVERTAAQERSLSEDDRYIIPVRLDESALPGLPSTTADIRNATPTQVADLVISILILDEPVAAAISHPRGTPALILRATSLTEFDEEVLRSSFRPFKTRSANKTDFPVELRLPSFLLRTIEAFEKLIHSKAIDEYDQETRESFVRFVERIRSEAFPSMLRAPSWVLRASQPDHSAALELSDSAVSLIRRYVLAKSIALGRALLAHQLRGTPTPEWADVFADCDWTFSFGLMAGLPWLCRSEGTERFLWAQSNLVEWGPGRFSPIRIYLPSALILRDSSDAPSLTDVLTFVAPQLLERELEGERVSLLHSALHYPERMRAYNRGEFAIECRHFKEGHLTSWGREFADPVLIDMRDEILSAVQLGTLPRDQALSRLLTASTSFDSGRIFDDAIEGIFPEPANG